MKFYAVLLHFAKCRDLRVKCSATAQNRGKRVQPILAMPVFRPLFKRNGFPNSESSDCSNSDNYNSDSSNSDGSNSDGSKTYKMTLL